MRDFEKPVIPDCTKKNQDLYQKLDDLCNHLYDVLIRCSSGLLRLVVILDDLNKMDNLTEGQDNALSAWLKSLRHSIVNFIFATN